LEKIASIDIGSSSVKMLIVQKSLRKTEITETVLRPIPGDLPYFDAVHTILGELNAEFSLEGCTIVTAIPQQLVLTRNFSFPFSNSDVLNEIVLQEVTETLPLPVDDMIWNIKVTPQKSKSSEVLFAAAGSAAAAPYFACFTDNNLTPAFIGLESEAIYDAVRYTKTDSVINYVHCDIGYRKTVLTIVQNGAHTASQTILAGTGDIAAFCASLFKTDDVAAASKLELLHLDIESIDANLNTGFYKSLKLSKKQLSAIYEKSVEVLSSIAAHVLSTVQILRDENESSGFERLILTGGASNIRGISDLFYRIAAIPVASCEILGNTNNRQIQTRFFTAFGLIHTFHDRRERINLIGEKSDKSASSKLSQYHPAILFASVAFIAIALALLLSFIFTGSQRARNNDMLQQQFTKLYKTKIDKNKDPIDEAKKMLSAERKRREALEVIAPHEKKSMEILADIIGAFPDGEGFVLATLTLSESTITINGSSPDTQMLETFKTNLNSSGNFDSVNLNTNISSKNGTSFTMTVKAKASEKPKGPEKEKGDE